jgi:DNA repair photolyase
MKYELTRKSLSLMEKFKFGVFIITKSDLVLRDIDVLKRVDKVARAIVGVTITCDKDELSKVIEPKVSSSSERFKALKTFCDNGIDAGILLMPILPFINDTEENVRGIVRLAIDSKAKFIYPFFGVTLRDKQREFYYDNLEKSFPGLKNKYIERYGKNYSCESDNAKELYSLLAKLCDEAKILHRMEDINKLFEMNKEFEQLSLF